MQIPVGSKVADIGSGSGFYTLEIAKTLANTGKVFAIDVQKDFLSKIAREARERNLKNVEIIQGDVEVLGGTKLADKSIDICLLCSVLFQIEQKKDAINEVKRILVPSGKLIIIEWSDESKIHPDRKRVLKKSEAIHFLELNGFVKEREFDAGSHHYGIIFHKL